MSKEEKKELDPFQRAIEAYVKAQARKDLKFMQKLRAEGKSIEGCCDYIYSEVQSSKRKGFLDEEVFGMAMHYFQEDDVKAKKGSRPTVVVNHVPELTEAEKEAAREEARQKVLQDEMDKIQKKGKYKPKKEDKSEENPTLF